MKKKKKVLAPGNYEVSSMFGYSDKNLDAAVKQICQGNSLVKEIVDDDTVNKRHCIFGAVRDVLREAEDEYVEGERSWKDAIGLASQALAKLADAEKTLEDAYMKDHQIEEEEEDEEEDKKEVKKIVIPTKK